jgi:hypothetical protein
VTGCARRIVLNELADPRARCGGVVDDSSEVAQAPRPLNRGALDL